MDIRAALETGSRAGLAAAATSLAGLVEEMAGELGRFHAPDAGGAEGQDPLGELAESCLSGLSAVARIEAATAALKVRLLSEYSEAATALEGPAESAYESSAREMSLVAEIACVLTVGERAAAALLGEAHALTTCLPAALDALQAGKISWQHARIIVDETTGLDHAAAAALEAHFLDPEAPDAARGAAAGELAPARFRRKVRAWRERHHPESLEARHEKSVQDRRVEYSPDRNGMAWISLYMPADTACAVWNKASALARGLQGPDEPRTLTQLRADVAAGLLLGTSGQRAGAAPYAKADVLVTVPVLALLGATDQPAELDNYGPIPASMARRLVAEGSGSFYRVLVDPRDGAPLEISRTSYRLTEPMKRWLKMRDATCTFPGCSNHTQDNENDHLTAWHHGGNTGVSNLGHVCPKHHRLKHRSLWRPDPATMDEPPGWTSPTGRHYPAEEPDWQRPQWPPGIGPGVSLVPPDRTTGEFSILERALAEYLAA
ncbi:HNH endonuclease signature motif containing protein [Pseudarthrobacter sp. fls2-241-R2A-127]|uniref:HNH endonuclease signature motif containing protein n=1 Tax=Pseudarthrobacter sp. fls2-241-R2A-127 TaxID=3040303 RepID=UPI002554A9BB|nr:HNH endonuclease signature motif containing protein [Pseudarthrobacter sp. fls2-241-R2A-127]